MIRLWLGDSLERLDELSEVRAFITDPPYGLEFMGKDWDAPWKTGAGMTKPGIGDRAIPWPSYGGAVAYGGANPTCETCGGRARGAKKCECAEPDWRVDGKPLEDKEGLNLSLRQKHAFQAWCVVWLTKCYAALVPGGVIKVFGGTRMFHRMAAAIEQAGFLLEPGESLEAWGYGSGFPKSLNVSKAIDKHLGFEQGVVGVGKGKGGENLNQAVRPGKGDSPDAKGCGAYGTGANQVTIDIPITALTSEEAKKFNGYGTAWKPAWEPFLVGRKVK